MAAAARKKPPTRGNTGLMRALHAAGRARKLDHDALHDLAEERYGVASLKDLSYYQITEFLDDLNKGEGAKPRWSAQRRAMMANHGRKDYDHSQDPVQLIGEREKQMLRDAAEFGGWTEQGLERFCRRQCGQAMPRTLAEFNKVFRPMKTMFARKGIWSREKWELFKQRKAVERGEG